MAVKLCGKRPRLWITNVVGPGRSIAGIEIANSRSETATACPEPAAPAGTSAKEMPTATATSTARRDRGAATGSATPLRRGGSGAILAARLARRGLRGRRVDSEAGRSLPSSPALPRSTNPAAVPPDRSEGGRRVEARTDPARGEPRLAAYEHAPQLRAKPDLGSGIPRPEADATVLVRGATRSVRALHASRKLNIRRAVPSRTPGCKPPAQEAPDGNRPAQAALRSSEGHAPSSPPPHCSLRLPPSAFVAVAAHPTASSPSRGGSAASAGPPSSASSPMSTRHRRPGR